MTSIVDIPKDDQIERDGSHLFIEKNPGNTLATFKQRYIASWSGADPVYSTQTVGSVAFTTNHPIDYTYKLANSNAIPFYPNIRNLNGSAYFKGFHVGAVTNLSSGTAGTWRWTNSPTGPLNGRGSFDTNVSYAGTDGGLAVSETNVFFAYKGEGWLSGSSQANQLFHYTTKDGAFLGQFGLPKIPGERNRPGAAGNVYSLSVVKVNGVTYVYTPDEGSHGIHRWRVHE